MDNIRKREINECEQKIKNLQFILSTQSDTINRIKTQGETEYVKVQIIKHKKMEEEKKAEIIELEDRVEKLKSGELDLDIKSKCAENKEHVNRKQKLKYDKIQEEKKDNIERTKQSKSYYNLNRTTDMESRYMKREIAKHWNIYEKSLATMPDYIKNNLKEMPNNKGYIWKGIYCFGELKANRNENTLMFNKKKGALEILEWNSMEYFVYTKVAKKRKELTEHGRRKRI